MVTYSIFQPANVQSKIKLLPKAYRRKHCSTVPQEFNTPAKATQSRLATAGFGRAANKMGQRFILNHSASTFLLLWIFAVSAVFGVEKTICTVNATAAKSANCGSIINVFNASNSPCTNKLWKLRAKVTDKTSCSTVSVKVNITCASNHDKAAYQVRKELCTLNKTEAYVISNFSIKTYTFSANSKQRYDIEGGNRIELKNLKKKMYAAASTAKSRHTAVNFTTTKSPKSFNRFLMATNATIVVVNVINETGEQANLSVYVIISTPKAPLAHVSDDDYLLEVEKLCAYRDKANHWNDSVCKIENENGTETTCKCNHNSAFAIIFAVREVNIDNNGLKLVSTVLEVVSMVLLFLTVVLLGIYRQRMRNFDRVLVQISLCLALFCSHLFITISPLALHSGHICVAIAIVGHYFLVATSVLMVMEGALMLTTVLAPNFLASASSNSKRRRITGMVVSWLLPMLYVGICAAVSISLSESANEYARWSDHKGRHQACWISTKNNLILVVVVPVALAIVINTGIAVRLGVLVWKMSKSAEEFKPSNMRDINKASHAGKAFRAIVILLPILGLPWVLGFLVVIYPVELVFMSIHVVVNGLQGAMLFVHYVATNSEMRSSLHRSWKTTMSSIGQVTTPTVQFTSNANRSDSTVALKSD